MDNASTLLIEIGTEELPPKSLKRLADSFADTLAQKLMAAQLIETADQVARYAAPRRLAVSVNQVAQRQPDQQLERRGPAVKAAWDEAGAPTKATLGFARSCGVEPQDLETLSTDKGEWLTYRNLQPGKMAVDLVPTMVLEAVRQLPIDRRMRWGAGDGEFVRPVHWLVALLGSEVVDFDLFGIRSGRNSRGHRFHANHDICLADADSYLGALRDAHVVADYAERQDLIVAQAETLAKGVGGSVVLEPALLDEVTSLVEWPQAVLGNFDDEFLQVPAEALIASMGDHQKYFHLLDDEQRLLAHFITISNLDSPDSSLIVAGNQRVLRARLADAQFFWENDCKRSLRQLAAGLSAVVFQQKLGTLADKSERLTRLLKVILTAVDSELDVQLSEDAAVLCKADLLSDMVGEFPALQGMMGQYYARADGLDDAVGEAIREHYLPRFAGDELPKTVLGAALALADRVDTLVGIFAIGAIPSGDKDPFGLRRAALGVLRIQLEFGLDLQLFPLLEEAVAGLPEALQDNALAGRVNNFVSDRYRGYAESAGYAHDEIEAVLAVKPSRLLDAQGRLQAVQQFRSNPAAASLAAANKRVANILNKSAENVTGDVDAELLVEPEEQVLYQALQVCEQAVLPIIADRDYLAVCQQLAGLREVVDGFFDAVMVMADDKQLRDNRLALLRQMRELFLQVADFSCLQG
ncbi:MAG: glycine--tRNA ligase subunit beta [Gammaproteobacteria bacterium]|nr:MAG: glycine--tRNA ligase subunit beta [Gammaproteobacteria bacterium]